MLVACLCAEASGLTLAAVSEVEIAWVVGLYLLLEEDRGERFGEEEDNADEGSAGNDHDEPEDPAPGEGGCGNEAADKWTLGSNGYFICVSVSL